MLCSDAETKLYVTPHILKRVVLFNVALRNTVINILRLISLSQKCLINVTFLITNITFNRSKVRYVYHQLSY